MDNRPAGARGQDTSSLLSRSDKGGRWYGAAEPSRGEVPVRLGLSAANTAGGATLSYHDIVYSVKEKLLPCSKGVGKVVLKGVSGIMKPGLNAIAGATGSGKTTLLDILSGRKASLSPNSHVLLNGEPLPSNYNCMSGYVVQDDVLMGTLTVKENIQFSASLRIAGGVSSIERKTCVDNLLKDLSLEEVADSKIGTKMVRGVSGGEKKRTSIAMELVASPAVLYLDEPTTGLDAFTAVQIMQILYKLAREGETIICSIHQPRYAIFKLFDSLTLLNYGETVYHGPAKDSIDYFASQGVVCEEHANPMDIFLDALHDHNSVVPYAENYQQSSIAMTIQNDLHSESESHQPNSLSVHHNKVQNITYPSGFFRQLGVLSKRSFINFLRDPALCINEFVGDIFMALMVGAIYFQLSKDSTNAILDRAGALFVIVMLMIFPSIISIELFAKQRILFVHESVSGYYQLMPYFLGRVGCDILPWRIAPMICFGITAYWMIGLTAVVTKFFFFMLTLLMTCLAATSFAFFFSSMVPDQAVATLSLAITFVVMSMYAGLFVNLHSPPIFLQWLAWISVFRYGYEALLINEIEGQVYTSKSNSSCGQPFNGSGSAYLESQHFHTNHKWLCIGALGVITIVMLALTYIRLGVMRRAK